MIEDYAGVMADTIRQHGADGLVLRQTPVAANYWRQNLGYRLKAAVSNDASTVSVQDGKATVKHMVLRWSGDWRRTHCHAVCGTDHQQRHVRCGSARRVTHWRNAHTVEWQAPAVAITRTRQPRRARATASISTKPVWSSASVAVWQQREHCAGRTALQGDRCGVGLFSSGGGKRKWMEHERYVGISNLMLKPELYLAVGISGRSITWLALMHRKPFRHQ